MVRYFTQQIQHVFRRHAVKLIHNEISIGDYTQSFANTIASIEKFFVVEMNENPYLMHGEIESYLSTKEMLKNMLVLKLNAFKAAVKDEQVVFEEHTVDDSLLLEGERNLRDYLQSKGYFEAEVEYKPQRVIDDKATIDYLINPGERHKLMRSTFKATNTSGRRPSASGCS